MSHIWLALILLLCCCNLLEAVKDTSNIKKLPLKKKPIGQAHVNTHEPSPEPEKVQVKVSWPSKWILHWYHGFDDQPFQLENYASLASAKLVLNPTTIHVYTPQSLSGKWWDKAKSVADKVIHVDKTLDPWKSHEHDEWLRLARERARDKDPALALKLIHLHVHGGMVMDSDVLILKPLTKREYAAEFCLGNEVGEEGYPTSIMTAQPSSQFTTLWLAKFANSLPPDSPKELSLVYDSISSLSYPSYLRQVVRHRGAYIVVIPNDALVYPSTPNRDDLLTLHLGQRQILLYHYSIKLWKSRISHWLRVPTTSATVTDMDGVVLCLLRKILQAAETPRKQTQFGDIVCPDPREVWSRDVTGYWGMEERLASSVLDASGNGLHGHIMNINGFMENPRKAEKHRHVVLSGDTFMYLPLQNDFWNKTLSMQKATLAALVRFPNLPEDGGAIMSIETTNSAITIATKHIRERVGVHAELQILPHSREPVPWLVFPASCHEKISIEPNVWHDIAVVMDGYSLDVYFDGNLVMTTKIQRVEDIRNVWLSIVAPENPFTSPSFSGSHMDVNRFVAFRRSLTPPAVLQLADTAKIKTKNIISSVLATHKDWLRGLSERAAAHKGVVAQITTQGKLVQSNNTFYIDMTRSCSLETTRQGSILKGCNKIGLSTPSTSFFPAHALTGLFVGSLKIKARQPLGDEVMHMEFGRNRYISVLYSDLNGFIVQAFDGYDLVQHKSSEQHHVRDKKCPRGYSCLDGTLALSLSTSSHLGHLYWSGARVMSFVLPWKDMFLQGLHVGDSDTSVDVQVYTLQIFSEEWEQTKAIQVTRDYISSMASFPVPDVKRLQGKSDQLVPLGDVMSLGSNEHTISFLIPSSDASYGSDFDAQIHIDDTTVVYHVKLSYEITSRGLIVRASHTCWNSGRAAIHLIEPHWNLFIRWAKMCRENSNLLGPLVDQQTQVVPSDGLTTQKVGGGQANPNTILTLSFLLVFLVLGRQLRTWLLLRRYLRRGWRWYQKSEMQNVFLVLSSTVLAWSLAKQFAPSVFVLENEPFISVIVPCYNQEKYLFEALNSVVTQTMTNWEMVIVNDGSPDNCGSLGKAYAKQRPHLRIRAVDKQNGGLASARNHGIDRCVGFWICALDADDYLAPTYLHHVSNVIRDQPHVTMIDANQQFFYESDWKWNVPTFSRKGTLYSGQFPVNTVYKKSDWQQAGRYTEVLPWGNEDWNLWISLGTLGPQVTAHKINEFLLYYRYKRKSMQRDMIKYNEVVPMLQTMHANEYPVEEILQDHRVIMREIKMETFEVLVKKLLDPRLSRDPMLRLWLGMYWDGMFDYRKALHEYSTAMQAVEDGQMVDGMDSGACMWQVLLRLSNLFSRSGEIEKATEFCERAKKIQAVIKSC